MTSTAAWSREHPCVDLNTADGTKTVRLGPPTGSDNEVAVSTTARVLFAAAKERQVPSSFEPPETEPKTATYIRVPTTEKPAV